MDLNYYLERETVERVRAAQAPSAKARQAHGDMAALYRERIDGYRKEIGAPSPRLPQR
jgi:muconolactone delta-isomerase